MTPPSSNESLERRRQIDRIFAEALEQPDEELTAFLDRVCGDDSELRFRVDALLADDESDTLLQTAGAASESLMRRLASDLSHETESVEGSLIGPYRIDRELGRGGMAVVYLADRADGAFDQQVAIKLIQTGLDSEERIHRFLTERQILAGLKHPYIAHLLDGGLTDQGRPYFAMEYVAGRPIDRFVIDRKLSIPDRLRLFVKVGEAIQAAHQRLVVHRDIKPSNILVNQDGDPKLLDFGIAKLLAPDHDHRTRTSVKLLTPEYASPEQVLGEPITTATDVYQLGVLLYLLITGRNPQDLTGASLMEIHRVVCEKEPSRPSTVVMSDTIDTAGQGLILKPRRLRRQIQGDLDTVVLKALRKNPAERYGSVAQMVEDVERYLDGRPISARAPSLSYRLRKLVSRYKLATASVVLVLGMTVFYTSWLSVERTRAQEAAERAEQMADALVNVLDFDLYTARGGRITVQELLDRSISKIEQDLEDHPEIQYRLRNLMADAYQKLGANSSAEEQLEIALSQGREELGDDHLEVGRALMIRGVTLDNQNRFREAKELLGEALFLFEVLDPEPKAEIAEAKMALTRLAWVYREYDEAHRLSTEALALKESLVGSEDERLVPFLAARAQVFLAQKEPSKALPFLRRAVSLFGSENDPPRAAPVLGDLGQALSRVEQWEEGEQILQRAVRASSLALGADHPRTVNLQIELGRVVGGMGRHDEAVDLLRQGLEALRARHGDSSPTTLRTAAFYGEQLMRAGKLGEAEALYRRALELVEQSLGEENAHTYTAVLNLAEVLDHSGQIEESLENYRRTVYLLEQQPDLAPQHLAHARERIRVLSGQSGS